MAQQGQEPRDESSDSGKRTSTTRPATKKRGREQLVMKETRKKLQDAAVTMLGQVGPDVKSIPRPLPDLRVKEGRPLPT